MMESHDEHKNESTNTRTGLRVKIGVMAALVAFITIGLIRYWNWEPPLFPDVDSIQEMTLISVDGIVESGWREIDFHSLPKEEIFYGYPILGMVEITHPQDRQAILSTIHRGANERTIAPLACFYPRHALRIRTDHAIYEYNICFQCGAIYKYVNSERVRGAPTSDSPQTFLNTFFEKAGVPIAPEGDELKEIMQKKQQQEREENLPATEEE